MGDPIISIRGLSKCYQLGRDQGQRSRYVSLREALTQRVTDVLHGRTSAPERPKQEFWALKDVTFDIERGEAIGIIGRNGAGKSTLLKVLSRITEPSAGRVELKGRVASLLEVGTGFHPELTGRENIFLNGAILGMSQAEVRRKFDEIVTFADVERFLDTPVKRYSSGMYVRLAFSVAAHLDPDILIVDEVLAVGDSEFQRKCLGKMDEVSREIGRTVLFVSHNIAAIQALTQRAVFLDKGQVAAVGPTEAVVAQYIKSSARSETYKATRHSPTPYFERIELSTSEGGGVQQFGDALELRLRVRHENPMRRGCMSIQIVDQYNRGVLHAWADYTEHQFGRQSGASELRCRFPALKLNVGRYSLNANLSEPPDGEVYERVTNVCGFEVIRTRDSMLWGFHPETCTHYEDCSWDVLSEQNHMTSEETESRDHVGSG